MHKTEHKQPTGSSGGPREGGKLRPTTELWAFNTGPLLKSEQLWVLFFISRLHKWIILLRSSGSGRERVVSEGELEFDRCESWFIHMCSAVGAPPHTPSLESPCRSTVTPLPTHHSCKCQSSVTALLPLPSPPCCSLLSNQGFPLWLTEPKLCVSFFIIFKICC